MTAGTLCISPFWGDDYWSLIDTTGEIDSCLYCPWWVYSPHLVEHVSYVQTLDEAKAFISQFSTA